MVAGQVGADVIAVDIDSEGLHRLPERMRSTAARSFLRHQWDCDAGPLPLPDGVASVVLAKEVMEHLENPARFLAELLRIGQPGARYFISVPDPASESLMQIVAPEYYWKKPCHLHVFERKALDQLVESAGLEVGRRVSCGFYWSMWWCFRMAIGTDYFPGHPGHSSPPPILADWENVWKALEASPHVALVTARLDRLIPKSQIVMASKPAEANLGGIGAHHNLGPAEPATSAAVGLPAGRLLQEIVAGIGRRIGIAIDAGSIRGGRRHDGPRGPRTAEGLGHDHDLVRAELRGRDPQPALPGRPSGILHRRGRELADVSSP